MKKIAFGFSILAVAAVVMIGCKKEKDEEIVPDTEFQSSVDVSYAAQVITDIDMIMAYAGENDQELSRFFRHVPASSSTSSVVTISRDTVLKYIFVSFNKALCRDGHRRDGSISLNYDNSNPNSKYTRDFGFIGKIRLIAYKIDDWAVTSLNDFEIKNLVAPVNYSPTTTNLSWSLKGDFRMKHPTDSTKNMRVEANLVKTLKNTADKIVFPPSKQAAINWSISVCEYKGMMFGQTNANVPFKYEILESRPLIRDFVCSPDKVAGTVVGTNSVSARYEMYTPFTDGASSFTTSTKYPRVIYYGAEETGQPGPCDNAGTVMIKGISYPVDFKKNYTK